MKIQVIFWVTSLSPGPTGQWMYDLEEIYIAIVRAACIQFSITLKLLAKFINLIASPNTHHFIASYVFLSIPQALLWEWRKSGREAMKW